VGVTIDFGHALMSRENPAESLILADRYNKLFNIHINDAFREWDDDLMVGTVNVWETLEFLMYLKEIDYDGYLGLDMFPYREDSVEACSLSIKNIEAMLEKLEDFDMDELRRVQDKQDAVQIHEVARKLLF